MSQDIPPLDSPIKPPIPKYSLPEPYIHLNNALMAGTPPTPGASKSASPEYPEYPWLPNKHRDRPTQLSGRQQVDTHPRLSETNLPLNMTPDSPSNRDPLQRSFKREASPDDRELYRNMPAFRQGREANEASASVIGPNLQSLYDLPAESADDERDEDDDDVPESAPEVVDPFCTAVPKCVANSGDHRKVVSHIFGRNKTCTSQIPPECWILYCRKHYQRHRYRAKNTGWKRTQFDVIKRQLTRLESWGGVIDWEVALRKKERDELAIENRKALLNGTRPTYRESFLEPHLGRGKSFRDVDRILTVIENETRSSDAADLPGFEILPNIDSKLHPPIKASQNCTARGGNTHTSKSKISKKRKRAASTTAAAKLPAAVASSPTADTRPPRKRRHLVQASRLIDTSTTLRGDDTQPSSPAPPTVLGFQSINRQPHRQRRLPIRSARDDNGKARDSTDGSQYCEQTDEA